MPRRRKTEATDPATPAGAVQTDDGGRPIVNDDGTPAVNSAEGAPATTPTPAEKE